MSILSSGERGEREHTMVIKVRTWRWLSFRGWMDGRHVQCHSGRFWFDFHGLIDHQNGICNPYCWGCL